MQNFSFFEVVESQASMVMKALNKVTLNKGRKVIVEIAGENTGKSDKSGKKRGKESVREEKTTKKKETKSAEKKKINLAVKNEAIPPHVVLRRKMTGNSSSKMTIVLCVVKSRTLQKKAGRNEVSAKIKIHTINI